MRRLFAATLALAAMANGTAFADTIKAAISARMQAFETAFNAADIQAIGAFYAEDGVLYGPGFEPLIGRDKIAAQFANALSNNVTKLSVEVMEVDQPAPDTVIEIGRTVVSFGGGTARGQYLHVWKLEDGEWMLSRDIYNVTGVTK